VQRSVPATRLLVVLYVWAFPLLGFIHSEAAHHARLPACAGFAQEHSHPDAGSPVVSNLHVVTAEKHCTVCVLARSVTLSSHSAVGVAPPAPPLATFFPSTPACPASCSVGSLGSRAPPLV
jgi:hypothetical protein